VVEPLHGRDASIEEPLDFLRGNTYRQRQVGVVLESFTEGEAPADEIIAACEFLSIELPLHMFDVSDDVVPLLISRCKQSDNITPVVEEIAELQRFAKSNATKCINALMTQIERMSGKKPTEAVKRRVLELLTTLRRLSAIENGIILPLARVRLTDEDIAELSKQMQKRRGLTPD